ncbi:hypothetical protein K502DRAFT_322800 [Neoconidiobolus thromboides FSU 785]|nr:hypothetical protein K502DRAFT_322800 [Neoconidiobolus thromboides FSU 785]
MAGLFSLFTSSNNDAKYEKQLEEIEKKIKQKELTISEIKLNKGSAFTFYLYTVSAYLFYAAVYFILLRSPKFDNWESALIKASPLIFFPVLAYVYHNSSNAYYQKRLNSETDQLSALKTKLRITIDELKKNSSYYKTKSILERYEQEDREKAQVQRAAPKKASVPLAQSQTLRQRVPQNNGNNSQKQINAGIPLKPRTSQAPNIQVEGGQPWFGKLMDAIVGEEEKNMDATKFALICSNCFAHNGLVSANDYNIIQYTCPKCNTFNPSRRSQRRKSVENLNLTEEQQQELMKRSMTAAPKPSVPKNRKVLPQEFMKNKDTPVASKNEAIKQE